MVFFFFGSFAHHFQIELCIHSSNCKSRFVSMSELEVFLLTRVVTLNFNTADLVIILEINKKTPHSDCSNHIEGNIMQNHKQKKK
jgi:hypothetical protein